MASHLADHVGPFPLGSVRGTSWSVASNEISSPSHAPVYETLDSVPLTPPPSLVDQILESRHGFWGSLSQEAIRLKLPFIRCGPGDGAYGVFYE